MEEKSHVSASSVKFVNDMVREVCLNGKSLSKFRSEIGRTFPDDDGFYGQIEEFVNAVKEVSKGEKEVDPAFLELRTMAQHICLTSDTVNAIIEPLKPMVKKPEEKLPERTRTTEPASKGNAPQSDAKGSRTKLYIVLFIILIFIIAILYFNSK